MPLILAENTECGRPDETWTSEYKLRVKRLVDARTWDVGPGTSDQDAGKRDWPALLAEMWKVRGDRPKLDKLIRNEGQTLLSSRWAGSFYKPFTEPGYTLYYSQYKDLLPKEQIEQIHRMIAAEGWNLMSRADHYMDPIYHRTEFNSENFNWMARFAGVYWAHEFRAPAHIAYFDGYLDNLVRSLFRAGRVEWNSNVYWGYTFQAALMLHESSSDPKIKAQAAAIMDWMVFEAALHYVDGFQAGADVRAKEGAYQLFAGSVWPYAYLYFTDTAHPPPYSDADAAAHLGVQEVGYVPYSSYRPPQVAIDIAQRKYPTPVEVQSAKPSYHLDEDNYGDWDGQAGRNRRFEFETIYLERDYTLASLATERPNGAVNVDGQRPFSEQNVWRLAVRGGQQGPLQIFGNSGANDTMAGRCPFEEIGQYGNVMLRAIHGANRMWVAIPKSVTVEMSGSTAFADLGRGVYVALAPYRALASSRRDFADPSYTQLVWTYDAGKLGGLALEAGTAREHGSYQQFKAKIAERAGLRAAAGDGLIYTSTAGKTLRLEFKPVGTYTMTDGTVVSPAGTLPRVWRDGQAVDYGSWESYQVVTGEKILEQKWGSGSLTAKVAGSGIAIRIDPATATPSCRVVSNSK